MNELLQMELIQKYADGTIGTADTAILLRTLREDRLALRSTVKELAIIDLLESMRVEKELAEWISRSVATLEDSDAENAAMAQRVLAALNDRPSGKSRKRINIDWSGRGLHMLAAAALLLLAVGVWKFGGMGSKPPRGVARVQSVVSVVSLARAENVLAVSKGMELCAGDVLRAGRGGVVAFGYDGENTHVELKDGTVVLGAVDAGKKLRLESGSMSAVVARQPDGKAMTIDTPHASAVVMGTKFSLQASAGSTRLGVDDGTVRFAFSGDTNFASVVSGEHANANASSGELTHYGMVLFKEDFRNGTEGWDIVFSDEATSNVSAGDRLANRAQEKLVSVADCVGQKGRKCFQIDASQTPVGQTIKLRQKRVYAEPGLAVILEYEAVSASRKGGNINMGWTFALGGVDVVTQKTLLDKKVDPLALGVRNELTSEMTICQTGPRQFLIERRDLRFGEEVNRIEAIGMGDKMPRMQPMLSTRNTKLQISRIEIRKIQRLLRGK